MSLYFFMVNIFEVKSAWSEVQGMCIFNLEWLCRIVHLVKNKITEFFYF